MTFIIPVIHLILFSASLVLIPYSIVRKRYHWLPALVFLFGASFIGVMCNRDELAGFAAWIGVVGQNWIT